MRSSLALVSTVGFCRLSCFVCQIHDDHIVLDATVENLTDVNKNSDVTPS